MTLEKLEARYLACDRRWTKALCRKGYPRDDDPEESALEGRPHTEAETALVKWADIWRQGLHLYEDALLAEPSVRAGLIEGLTLREPDTFYEPTV